MSGEHPILEKIRKLLRMRRGGTPAEVETALSMAAELARKHGIDLAAVDPDQEPATGIGHIDALTSARIGWECKYAALVVQEFFNVTVIHRRSAMPAGFCRQVVFHRLTFVGTRGDTEIARYVYSFLVRHFRHCWSTRRGRARNRRAFMHGMSHGVSRTLHEQRRRQVTEAGLVLISRAIAQRNDYIARQFGELKEQNISPDTDAVAATIAGYRAGLETQIRSGLSNGAQAAPKQIELFERKEAAVA